MPWLTAVALTATSLRKQRIEIRQTHPNDHMTRWAHRWEFIVPQYDEQNIGSGNLDPVTHVFTPAP
ncbi:hypothetical protein GGR57DRAFT_471694 [Xylariaceae sp. FL1272]|nr:hypothetical protein GGR57DRAFT_471694 [Xylariaceae sp. FL1272]